jgi:hypothetical protein
MPQAWATLYTIRDTGSLGAPVYAAHMASAGRLHVVCVVLMRQEAPGAHCGTLLRKNAWICASVIEPELKNTESLMMFPGLNWERSAARAASCGAAAPNAVSATSNVATASANRFIVIPPCFATMVWVSAQIAGGRTDVS